MIAAQEREKAIGLLPRSRQVVLDAVAGVTDSQPRWKPAVDRWSILEYVEHPAVADHQLVALVKAWFEPPARPENEPGRRQRRDNTRATTPPMAVNRAPS